MPTRVFRAPGFVRALRRDPGHCPSISAGSPCSRVPTILGVRPARAGARCWHALDQMGDSQGLRGGRDGAVEGTRTGQQAFLLGTAPSS